MHFYLIFFTITIVVNVSIAYYPCYNDLINLIPLCLLRKSAPNFLKFVRIYLFGLL